MGMGWGFMAIGRGWGSIETAMGLGSMAIGLGLGSMAMGMGWGSRVIESCLFLGGGRGCLDSVTVPDAECSLYPNCQFFLN